MIEVRQAKRILLEAVGPLEPVEVPLIEAHGRVLAESLAADRDYPPTDRSAMDGYAVRAADVDGAPVALRVTGEIRAGQAVGEVRVGERSAVKIFTGAIVPPGADAVVMVEHTAELRDRGLVRVLESARPGQNIRRCGEDARAGERVLSAGAPIHAAEIAALAAIGRVHVRVHRPPTIAVLSTGDELVDAERTPADHQVRNSNSWALLAQLNELGLEGRTLGVAGDDRERLAAALDEGFGHDVFLVTGGVSVGAYDLVREMLERAGMEVLFHKVAMKPGKPVLAGRRRACLVIGLPGNPVSAFVGLHVLVAPVLRRMMGHRTVDGLQVRATLLEPLRAKPGRTTYHLGRIEWSGSCWEARPIRSTSSGDVLSLARANALLVTSADTGSRPAGSQVQALPWFEAHLRSTAD